MSDPPSSATYLEAYTDLQRRVAERVGPDDAEVAVPACPGWTVRDVVAHLAGLCDDWVAGRLDGYASASWTASQVERFRNVDGSEICRHWDEALGAFAALDHDPDLGSPARWAFGDAVIHEADLRGALEAGRVPADAVDLAMVGSLTRWREVHDRAGLAPVEIRPTDRPAPSAPPAGASTAGAVVVEAPLYDIFRAIAGRRSAAQIAGWTWSQDPDPYIAAGPPYPFAWATHQIVD